jgi:hypothetical protein
MENKYLQFPLMMLKDAHINYDQAMHNIVTYGIVSWAMKQTITEQDAARQLIYMYYRDENIEPQYYDLVEETIEIDPDYNGFAGDSFQPEGVEDVIGLFDDPEVKEYALRHCRLQKINNFFGVTGMTNNHRFECYQDITTRITAHEVEYGADPQPTIDISLFWDMYKNHSPEIFTAYMAIKSLQGQRTYTRTDKPTIVGRMIGAKNRKVFIDVENKTLLSVYEKYTNRYHFEKLMFRLIDRGLIKGKISQKNWSKFLISTRLNFDQLADAYMYHRRQKDFKAKEEAARKKLQQVYNE